jgi:spoIIIJ-associated protein
MEWVETTGRSVEEALDAALDELGVDEDDVEYEVLEQAKAGLFGRLGGNPARIRARVKPMSREKPGERQRRNRRPGSRPRQGSRSGDQRESRGARGGGGSGGVAQRGTVTSPSDDDDEPSSDRGEGSGTGGSSRRRRRGGRARGSGAGLEDAASTSATRARTSSKETRTGSGAAGAEQRETSEPRAAREGNAMATIDPELSIEEQARIAEDFTTGLVEAFDLGAAVTLTIEDETILLSIDGSSVGLLVGPKGATLAAIEELVRTVVQRQTDGHGARINVDVGGYRAKRREALESFTRSLIEKVVDSGRAQALEPMSAADRKIVHDTAAEAGGVVTESEGEDPRRRVIIRPASGGDA